MLETITELEVRDYQQEKSMYKKTRRLAELRETLPKDHYIYMKMPY